MMESSLEGGKLPFWLRSRKWHATITEPGRIAKTQWRAEHPDRQWPAARSCRVARWLASLLFDKAQDVTWYNDISGQPGTQNVPRFSVLFPYAPAVTNVSFSFTRIGGSGILRDICKRPTSTGLNESA